MRSLYHSPGTCRRGRWPTKARTLKLGPWRFTWALHRGLYQPPTAEQQAQEAEAFAEDWSSEADKVYDCQCEVYLGDPPTLAHFTNCPQAPKTTNSTSEPPPSGAGECSCPAFDGNQARSFICPIHGEETTRQWKETLSQVERISETHGGPERCSWCDEWGWIKLGANMYCHRDDCPERSGKMRLGV